MQLAVTKKDLLRVLSRCQGVADKKSTMPVLGNVLLEIEGKDRLKLAATDLYVGVSGTVPVEVEKPGSIAVGARDLFERVKMMPEGKISIASDENATLTIKAAGQARRYTLHGVPGEEFPALPEPGDDVETLTLRVDVLSRLIALTYFSISGDETRLQLNSALFEWEGETIRMVSTDGHRLSKAEITSGGHEANTTMLIPNKGILELRRLADELSSESKDAELTIAQNGPNAFFGAGDLRFSVKLVDAQFPPYGQVIPKSSEHKITAPRGLVDDALKAVSVAANDRTGGVKVTISHNLLRFSSESPESGDGFDEVPIEYDGPEVTIGFNAKYLRDILGAIDAEDIALEVSGELDPVLVTPVEPKEADQDYMAVVMPMRI